MSKIKVITHNGDFHADDVFAMASLMLLHKNKIEIMRTRDEAIINKGANYVIDVGGIYDDERNIFDHHQSGGAGERSSGIPYASFGLLWKKIGIELCGSQDIAEEIDKKIVSQIDGWDNGLPLYDSKITNLKPYLVDQAITSFNLTWKEKIEDIDTRFLEAVMIAAKILEREVKKISDKKEAELIVEKIYNNAEDKRIIVFEKNYPFQEILSKYEEPLYVVSPDRINNNWHIATVRTEPHSFNNRKDLPYEWAGKRGVELAQITGVPDAIFCHNKCFVAVAQSKEGALKLAKIAVES